VPTDKKARYVPLAPSLGLMLERVLTDKKARYVPLAPSLGLMLERVLTDKKARYVPLAPSLGLMLERVMFRKENRTHGGFTTLLDFEAVAPRMSEFKKARIYPEIDGKERSEQKNAALDKQQGMFLDKQ
ncbi:hypothetical protein T484DRAFT_1813843, partial [Baffinella frigidus]